MTGYIDSVYCGSGVDGQGLRCVVFFSGCNLRCPFCHNPETLFKAGETTEADALLQKLKRYKPYFRRGGVTLSGGEPFLQADFFLELAGKLRAAGIRVCAETNGHICDERLIAACDQFCVIFDQSLFHGRLSIRFRLYHTPFGEKSQLFPQKRRAALSAQR